MAVEANHPQGLLSEEVRSKLLERLVRHLPFARWGFEPTYVKPKDGPRIIYDSPKCRVAFRLDIERGGDEIATYYGRRHAPNEDSLIEWNGELCFPWHNLWVLNVTEFLEGLSAAEVIELERNKLDSPVRIAFRNTKPGRELTAPDWGLALHAFVWERFGDRLFSLFDLGEPQLWEKFRLFVRECYELRPKPRALGMELSGVPPWNIC